MKKIILLVAAAIVVYSCKKLGEGEYRKIRPLKFDVASANAADTGNGFTFDEGD